MGLDRCAKCGEELTAEEKKCPKCGAEGTEEVPQRHPLRAATWAAEHAIYLSEAAQKLRQSAEAAEECGGDALVSRGVKEKLSSIAELQPSEQLHAGRARGRACASALLSLFAIEVALKAYQFRDLGKREFRHDLKCLFDSLKPGTQADLDRLVPELQDTLKKHPNGFVSLRYMYEDLADLNVVKIPKPSDPLHSAAVNIAAALRADPELQKVAARAAEFGRRKRSTEKG